MVKKISTSMLDKVFELYVRWRDDWTCITCGDHIHNNRVLMHAGHYIGRGNYSTRWNEKNVNAQCRRCNSKEHWAGDKNTYALALKRRYGESILDDLEELKHKAIKPNKQALYDHYTKKLAEYTDKVVK